MNPEKRRKQQKEWRTENKDRSNEIAQIWKKRYPQKRKDSDIWYRYKISHDQLIDMIHGQNSRCAICRDPITTPNIDHDHTTNKIRGILCRDCNLLLGYAKDKITILLSAIKYLKKNGPEQVFD